MSGDDGEIWRIDPARGNSLPIGSTDVPMTDIAFSNSGTLYGISFDTLFTIDLATGASTDVDPLNISGAIGLEFDATGTLYLSTIGGQLHTVDPSTGNTSLVGNLGFSSSGDLSFAPDGSLFMSATAPGSTDELISVDTATGVGTKVGDIGFAGVFGLEFVGNLMFGTTNQGELLLIDPTDGTGTSIGQVSPAVGVLGASVLKNAEPTDDYFLSDARERPSWGGLHYDHQQQWRCRNHLY